MNKNAAECRQLADRIDVGFQTGYLDPEEAMGELRSLALQYAARCDGLEATIRARYEGMALV